MNTTAVIFDFDGTLIDSLPAHRSITRRVLAHHGIGITDEEFARYNGMRAKDGYALLVKDHNVPVSVKTLIKERRKLMSHVMETVTLYPQAPACLERLENYTLAVATSSGRSYLDSFIKRFGIGNAFAATVTGTEVKNAKPYPDIFLQAAHKLQTAPDQCVVIEDAPNGVIAAKRAGMIVVALLTTTQKKYFTEEAEPDVFIKDLGELNKTTIKKAEAKAYIRRQLSAKEE